MKIVDERIEMNPVMFGDLNRGDAFECLDGFYLKLDMNEKANNAFNLKTNTCATFNLDDAVEELKAELVIRGTKHD